MPPEKNTIHSSGASLKLDTALGVKVDSQLSFVRRVTFSAATLAAAVSIGKVTAPGMKDLALLNHSCTVSWSGFCCCAATIAGNARRNAEVKRMLKQRLCFEFDRGSTVEIKNMVRRRV